MPSPGPSSMRTSTPWTSAPCACAKSRFPLIALLLAASLTLCGCPRSAVIPDRTVAHEVAEDATVAVWCRVQEGWRKCEVEIGQGWWVLSPEAAARAGEAK